MSEELVPEFDHCDVYFGFDDPFPAMVEENFAVLAEPAHSQSHFNFPVSKPNADSHLTGQQLQRLPSLANLLPVVDQNSYVPENQPQQQNLTCYDNVHLASDCNNQPPVSVVSMSEYPLDASQWPNTNSLENYLWDDQSNTSSVELLASDADDASSFDDSRSTSFDDALHGISEQSKALNRRMRRRSPTQAQRYAANVRERKRMYNLNHAFESLKQQIPTFAYERNLSRIETLRLAINYIHFMKQLLDSPPDEMQKKYANAKQEMIIKWSANV